MKLHHIAFWTRDIQGMVDFYQEHFNGRILFTHEIEDFSCAFLEIGSSITIELMTKPGLDKSLLQEMTGYSHFSIEVESKEEVNRLTDHFIRKGIKLEKNKVQYDDGFYESSIFDPDGNIIELAYVDRAVNSAV